jgi:hypothetical protein
MPVWWKVLSVELGLEPQWVQLLEPGLEQRQDPDLDGEPEPVRVRAALQRELEPEQAASRPAVSQQVLVLVPERAASRPAVSQRVPVPERAASRPAVSQRVPVPERAASRPAVSQQVLVLVPVRGRAASQREPETEHRSILREALLGIPYLDLGLDEVQDLERDREQQFQDLE